MVPRHRILLGISTVQGGLGRTCDTSYLTVLPYSQVSVFLTFIDLLALALSISHYAFGV
jgi:hypothetical protein